MQIIKSVSELKNAVAKLDGSVGYVPTMGYLHEGHISLIKKSKSQNDITIVSVFVNPTQFLPNEDYEKYPKNEIADIKTCELSGVDMLFMPTPKEMYPSKDSSIIAPKELSTILEGATRPGHFDGVLTVLNKFFHLIKPQKVYFGKKDTQQLIIVKKFIQTTFMDIEVVPCDIVRSSDGLALSSRNSYLDEEDKLNALKISRSLLKASNLIKSGVTQTKEIKPAMQQVLEPLKVDYVEITNYMLEPIENIELTNTIILVAAYVGKTRLIDNMWI
ncbi:MAG: pantoate--beta-alanine ligase [Campylobacter sp.]|nr:pantoate--beta-alanine ligase [Campylobacter sp.]